MNNKALIFSIQFTEFFWAKNYLFYFSTAIVGSPIIYIAIFRKTENGKCWIETFTFGYCDKKIIFVLNFFVISAQKTL